MRDELFWAKVDRSGGDDACWPWTGGKFHFGHGAVTRHGKSMRAHRYAWEQIVGPIPAGLCVLHRCDNPPCCNPAHLFLGTKADNNADKKQKGRSVSGFKGRFKTHCKHGHLLPPPSEQTKDRHRRCLPCGAAKTQRYRQKNIERYREADRLYQRRRRAAAKAHA